jgi:hypothetical protein
MSLGAKETAAFNRPTKARYSELAAKWLPKGRPVIIDAQTRETVRAREVAKTDGREQFKRNNGRQEISEEGGEADLSERVKRADAWEVEHFLDFV